MCYLDQFLNNKVSQGSVVTRLRCGGIFNDHSVTQSLLSPKVKNFDNWSTFVEVMGKHLVSCFFFTYGVVYLRTISCHQCLHQVSRLQNKHSCCMYVLVNVCLLCYFRITLACSKVDTVSATHLLAVNCT